MHCLWRRRQVSTAGGAGRDFVLSESRQTVCVKLVTTGQIDDRALGERLLAHRAVGGGLVAATQIAVRLASVVARALATVGDHEDVPLRAQGKPLLVDGADLCLAVVLLQLQHHRDLEGAKETVTRDAGASETVTDACHRAVAEARREGGKAGELGVAGLDGQGVIVLGDGSRELRCPEDVIKSDLCCVCVCVCVVAAPETRK